MSNIATLLGVIFILNVLIDTFLIYAIEKYLKNNQLAKAERCSSILTAWNIAFCLAWLAPIIFIFVPSDAPSLSGAITTFFAFFGGTVNAFIICTYKERIRKHYLHFWIHRR